MWPGFKEIQQQEKETLWWQQPSASLSQTSVGSFQPAARKCCQPLLYSMHKCSMTGFYGCITCLSLIYILSSLFEWFSNLQNNFL